MAGKKKSSKNRKTEAKKVLNMKPEHLIKMAAADLASANVRNAISLYKQALKNNGNAEEINTLLFKAYLIRNKQLLSKGMEKEAEVTLENAMKFKPDAGDLSEEDIFLCLEMLNVTSGIKLYYDYCSAKGFLPSAEKIIANKIIVSAKVKDFDGIHKDSPLMKNSEEIKSAIVSMNKGDWGEALISLKSVPRLSPWADMKLFCRAMVSFAENDNKTLKRSLSQLSGSFPFSSTVSALSSYAEKNNPDFLFDLPFAQNLLFEGHNGIFSLIGDLLKKLDCDDLKGAGPVIKSLAPVLSSEEPDLAAAALMDIIWQRCRNQGEKHFNYINLTKKLLSSEAALLTNARAAFNYGVALFSDAINYLGILDREFPEPGENAVARSEIFTYIASELINEGINAFDDWHSYEDFTAMLPSSDDLNKNTEILPFLLIEHAVNIDPANRLAYELVEECSIDGIPSKRLELFYETMMQRFPDDPAPCLKLADLYDRKGAYRKAEKILKDAMKLAPQNNIVLERYAFSFVIAAEKNLRAGKLHLVEKDLIKAEEFNIASQSVIVAEKMILYQLMKNPCAAPDSVINEYISSFSLMQQLRILSLLSGDISSKKKGIKKELVAFFKQILKKNMTKLSSKDRADLLLPIDSKAMLAFSDFPIGELFLKNDKKFLNGINDNDMMTLLTFPNVIQHSILSEFEKNLKQRLKKAAIPDKTILTFCHSALEYVHGDYDIEEKLYNTAKGVSAEIEKRLRVISKNFAPLAYDSVIRRNLLKFHFDSFRYSFGINDDFAPDFMDHMYYDDDDDYDDIMSEMEIMASFVMGITTISKNSSADFKNNLINDINIIAKQKEFKYLPDSMILESRRDLLNIMPLLRTPMDNAFSILEEKFLGKLSREAYIFFSGKLLKK